MHIHVNVIWCVFSPLCVNHHFLWCKNGVQIDLCVCLACVCMIYRSL